MEIGKRRKKLQPKREDRISDLPDHIIHHILFLLPSTKQAIQTAILSKRWRNQWTHVPILIFDPTGMSYQSFLQFIYNTIIFHNCEKIEKFHLQYPSGIEKDTTFDPEITFATRKKVEELYLSSITHESYPNHHFKYASLVKLPNLLFNNASLVKLSVVGGIIMPDRNVNWGCLTSLSMIHCKLTDESMKHILSGSPLLKSLELRDYYKFLKLDITSKSLKRLVLRQDLLDCILDRKLSALEISCPNLEELTLNGVDINDPKLFGQAIGNVLSTSPLLETIELIGAVGVIDPLVIASNSLKRVSLRSNLKNSYIEISCPHLEELVLSGCMDVKTAKLLNLPSSLCATIDFHHIGMEWENDTNATNEIRKSLVKDILHQLQHIKELTIGSWFIELLSAWKVEDLFSIVLNTKCLTLKCRDLCGKYSGIACLLRNSPTLEKICINLQDYSKYVDLPRLEYCLENSWNSNATVFNCLESHIKTIKIIGFPKKDGNRKLVLNFVQYLLKNAKLLEKMVIVLKDHGTTFPFKVSQELLSLPRYSRCSIIEVQCSK